MKAVQIVSPNNLQIIDVEKPSIDEKNNVMIKMTAAGICGSDVGIYHGTNAAATYPRIIGHEMVGRVDEVGSNVKNLKVGDRVIVGMGAIVLDGAKIGDDCIIAAGAVVTGKMDAPAGSLLVGSPAVVAKPLNDKQKASCLENSELYYRKSVEYRAFLAQQGK